MTKDCEGKKRDFFWSKHRDREKFTCVFFGKPSSNIIDLRGPLRSFNNKNIALIDDMITCIVYVWQILFDVQLQIQSVTWRFQKRKRVTSTFSSKMLSRYHTPNSMCHFNFQSVTWSVVFFFTSHTTRQNLNFVYQLTCKFYFFVQVFVCQCQKLAKPL